MTDVIRVEALAFLTGALGENSAGISNTGIDMTGAGPRVRWDVPRLSRPRVSDRGRVYREGVSELVSRMIALRWQGSQSPRVPPKESYLQLHDDYPGVFTTTQETSSGWHWMLAAAAEWILEDGNPAAAGHVTRQVKSKFAELRWYVGGPTSERMREIIVAAEWLSGAVCETCGAPGSLRRGGWAVTACDEHARKR